MQGLFIQRHAEVAAAFANVSVLYLCAAPEKPNGFEIIQTIENEVNTVIVYYGTRLSIPNIIAQPVKAVLFVKAFLKGYKKCYPLLKPDLVHVNVLTRMGLFALWLKVCNGIRYVITEHWSRYLPTVATYKGVFRKMATRLVVKYASVVSTVSKDLALAMKQHNLLNNKYIVLPNVVDTGNFMLSKIKKDDHKKRILHISCFEDRSKNISGLLRTIKQLSLHRDDFECEMVGDGTDFERMKSYANQLGLDNTVLNFRGLLENDQVIESYQTADFMVMFSNYENMPVVISESFACGVPVIATKVGGIPEYVNESNGILIDKQDEMALLNALNYMLDHCEEYDKTAIRAMAVETFGNKAVAAKLKEIYVSAGLNFTDLKQ